MPNRAYKRISSLAELLLQYTTFILPIIINAYRAITAFERDTLICELIGPHIRLTTLVPPLVARWQCDS